MARMNATPDNWFGADTYLGKRNERVIGHNTRIERAGNGDASIVIKYHGNEIVRYTTESVTYSSCGWRTVTTKQRINEFLPAGWHVWAEHGEWYLGHGWDDKNRYVWADGITILNDGTVTGAGTESDVERVKNTSKRIRKYVAGFMDALIHGKVAKPGNGDCWYCLMKTEDGQTLGEASHSDHLESHFEDKYYVGSLLMRAIDQYPVSKMVQWALGDLWGGDQPKALNEFTADIVRRQAGSSLTRYLKHELEIAR